MTRLLGYLVFLSLLGGCAGTYRIAAPELAVPTPTRIRDLRPTMEREGKLIAYSRDIPATALGDSSFQPDRLAVLEQRLVQSLGPTLGSIEVEHFSVVLLLQTNSLYGQLSFPNRPESFKGITDYSTTWALVDLQGKADGRPFSSSHAEPFPKGALGQQHITMQRAIEGAIGKAVNAMAARSNQ